MDHHTKNDDTRKENRRQKVHTSPSHAGCQRNARVNELAHMTGRHSQEDNTPAAQVSWRSARRSDVAEESTTT